MADIQYNNTPIIIIGAGGMAREIASWNATSKNSNKYEIVGFLDDNLNSLDNYNSDIKIIGKVDLSLVEENQAIVFAISDVEVKRELLEKAAISNTKIASYVHETCLVGQRTQVGIGLVMMPYALISCDTKIGDLVFINNGSQIGHDVTIGDFTSIMANVDIGGGAIIGNNVFIGSNAVILPGVKIPDNTRIGAGSVVLKTIKQSGTYFGNPAKKIF